MHAIKSWARCGFLCKSHAFCFAQSLRPVEFQDCLYHRKEIQMISILAARLPCAPEVACLGTPGLEIPAFWHTTLETPAFGHTSVGNTSVLTHRRWKYPRFDTTLGNYPRFDTPALDIPAFGHTSAGNARGLAHFAGNTRVLTHPRWEHPRLGTPRRKYLRLGTPRWKNQRFDTPAPETPACWHTSAGKPAFGRTTLEIPAFGHRRRARDRVLRRLSWRRGCGVY